MVAGMERASSSATTAPGPTPASINAWASRFAARSSWA
ncbi:hypothetical protein LAUMK4_03041 [Mycobacterium persicum]|uniref:Uncharacterized protein n=1 Tax=Mycobacterium persicum TaxID=1487726 RepID=A0AB38UU82_9MYCO|nr:hypothetical protein LAUMK15_03364 [Mycobacterium persicum]VAZ84272.1 hypothetical protein LAUMK42_03091 [Mycobacterium persicum]VAZ95159.1 hypothetical protein LAUMK4_03041 [Mycobacterium persicum]